MAGRLWHPGTTNVLAVTQRPTSTHGRSLLAPLLAICVATLGAILMAVAVGAALMSLWFGYRELSRRGDSAATTIERLLAAMGSVPPANSGLRPLLDNLDVDPDIVAAAVTDAAGQPLFVYSNAKDPLAGEASGRLLGHERGWRWRLVIAERPLGAIGPGAVRVAVAYNTWPARVRAGSQLVFFGLGGVVALIAVSLALAVMFERQIKALRALARATTALADERYEADVPGLDRSDEIGAMARAIESFKARLMDRERLRVQAEMDSRQSTDRHTKMNERVESFRSAIRSSLREVAGLSDQMQVSADSLATVANQTTARAEGAVAAIRQTSANVSTVAESSEDLSASIREIERQVEQTRTIVVTATRSTAETSNMIKGLFSKSEKIDEIIGLIQAIAAQTNLLSLNATIEAARAGESGRGFAVVAQEVKSLADQTARASQHVAEHVRAIQIATSEAVEAIGGIDATMAQAEQFSAIITVAVERQATATAAISRSAADAAKAAEEAADSMKRLAAAVGETDQSAAQVHQSATDVGLQAHDLSATIDAFLSDTASLRDGRGGRHAA